MAAFAFVTVAPLDAHFGLCRVSRSLSGAARGSCDCKAFSLGGVRSAPAVGSDEAPAKVRAHTARGARPAARVLEAGVEQQKSGGRNPAAAASRGWCASARALGTFLARSGAARAAVCRAQKLSAC